MIRHARSGQIGEVTFFNPFRDLAIKLRFVFTSKGQVVASETYAFPASLSPIDYDAPVVDQSPSNILANSSNTTLLPKASIDEVAPHSLTKTGA